MITRLPPSIVVLVAATSAMLVIPGSRAIAGQFPGGPGGPDRQGFGSPDVELVEQFDADGNGWLDADERRAARESLGSQTGGRGGRGFGRGGMAAGSPGPNLAPSDVTPVPASVPLYAPGTVRTLFLEFESPDWEAELMAFKSTDVEVPATLTVDGVRYEQVGVRFRGNSSFMMVPAGLKHSINLTLDLVDDDQNLLGFRTLNLLNSNGDPSQLRGALFEQIARHYLPVARVNFAQVVINGESWGIYGNVEQMNRDFIEDRFDGENGVRWKVPGSPGSRAGLEYTGDDPAPYKRLFEIKNKDNDESWAALAHLTKVLNTTPLDRLEAALEPILDIDGALKFLALDIVLANSDGYWTRGSDYFLYLDESGRFHVLPGDTNETFHVGGGPGRRGGGPGRVGGGGATPPNFGGRAEFGGRGGPGSEAGTSVGVLVGLDDETKPLRSKLLAVPALRERYLAYCREIAETWLAWDTIGPTAHQYHELIAPTVALDTRKLASTDEFESSLKELEDLLAARRAFVLQDLAAQ